jgi:hypothetical protein
MTGRPARRVHQPEGVTMHPPKPVPLEDVDLADLDVFDRNQA